MNFRVWWDWFLGKPGVVAPRLVPPIELDESGLKRAAEELMARKKYPKTLWVKTQMSVRSKPDGKPREVVYYDAEKDLNQLCWDETSASFEVGEYQLVSVRKVSHKVEVE